MLSCNYLNNVKLQNNNLVMPRRDNAILENRLIFNKVVFKENAIRIFNDC